MGEPAQRVREWESCPCLSWAAVLIRVALVVTGQQVELFLAAWVKVSRLQDLKAELTLPPAEGSIA